MKTIDLALWPFQKLVVTSLFLSAIHALIQWKWIALRYSTFGPRPFAAQALIVIEVVLIMVIFTIAMIHISDETRTGSNTPYYMGTGLAVLGWIFVSFII